MPGPLTRRNTASRNVQNVEMPLYLQKNNSEKENVIQKLVKSEHACSFL